MDMHEGRRAGVGEGEKVARVTSYLPPDVQIISKYHHTSGVVPFSVLAKLWEARNISEL